MSIALAHSRPRIVVRGTAEVGEGPVWDADRGLLHWVDIPHGRVHSSDVTDGTTRTRSLPRMVGAVALRSAGGLVFACDAGFGVLDDAGARIELEHSRVGERMNDAKVDPAGRLWAGSTALDFAAGRGALHVVDSSWRHEVALTGLTLPNGMDWSPDGKTYYLVDSYQRSLYAFDYVRSSGALGERRVLMTFPETWGLADGLTVDAAGRLWVAVWGGSRLLAISPDGDLLGSIDVPVVQPSSCAFGAAGYRTLFITSARDGLAVDADAADGSVFAVEVDGAYGRPVVAFGAPA